MAYPIHLNEVTAMAPAERAYVRDAIAAAERRGMKGPILIAAEYRYDEDEDESFMVNAYPCHGESVGGEGALWPSWAWPLDEWRAALAAVTPTAN